MVNGIVMLGTTPNFKSKFAYPNLIPSDNMLFRNASNLIAY